MHNKKNIAVSSDVKKWLNIYRRGDESYNDVIVKLLSHADVCDGFVENWFNQSDTPYTED